MRPAPLDHHEVDLTPVEVAEVAQLEVPPLGVLPEVHPLEQVRRHQVLEALRLAGDERPVEVVVLLLLLHGADPRRAERREPEDGVEALEDRHPAGHRLVADLEVLPQRVERQRASRRARAGAASAVSRRPRSCTRSRRGDLLAHEPLPVLARPAPRLDLGAAEEGLREPAERQQVRSSPGDPQTELGHRQGVQAQEVVPPLQRVAAEAVEVQPGAPGDQDPLAPRGARRTGPSGSGARPGTCGSRRTPTASPGAAPPAGCARGRPARPS